MASGSDRDTRLLESELMADFVADGQQLRDAFVVWPEVLAQNSGHVWDVGRPARSISSMSAQSFRRLKKALNTAYAILKSMHPQQTAPKIQLSNTNDYRESYANSVQVRVSLWDFYLMFGTINQSSADAVSIHNFQGIFLSPQQAKALANMLAQNVQQYESTFGEIKLEPHPAGPVIQ